MDLYGNVPLTTEISTELPTQSNRTELFNFIESELMDIESTLLASNEYGRVDNIAAHALLSRLYLNAEAWTGQDRYADCVTYSQNVINSGYTLNMNDANGNGTAYDELFLADNDVNGAQNEFIFALNFDGMQSQTWGGTTFLVHAAIGGTMNPAEFGVNGGWGGLRTTKNLVNQFAVDLDVLNTSLGAQSDWGLVGSATPNGWNGPDVEMYQTGPQEFSIYAELGSGELKFRFNEDWGNNFGDNGNDGTLESGGANIPISAGTYFIVMDLGAGTYTISPFSSDKRGMFHSDGQNLEIESIPPFEDGYAVTKWKNVDSNGNQGSDSAGNFVDTDIPLIRLAEIYLNYAEATLRGGGGDTNTAVSLINQIRERGFGGSSGTISSGDLTLDFILDERSRELYWEGLRRTDLIRYNRFTSSSYLWPFKGNEATGVGVDEYRNLFPLPANVVAINSNLTQNEGY